MTARKVILSNLRHYRGILLAANSDMSRREQEYLTGALIALQHVLLTIRQHRKDIR